MAVNDGRSVVTLNNDRAGPSAVVLRLTTACDPAGAVQAPSPAPGVRRYQRAGPGTGEFRATWYDLFPGGCLTYQLHSTSDVKGSFTAELPALLAFATRDALRQALTLDDELAEAYSALGIMAAKDYDWAAAEHQLRKALELNPSLARAHSDLAQSVLAPQGRLREALAENRMASELDPTNFQNALGDSWLAILERRYDAAVDGLKKVDAAYSHSQLPLFFLAQARMGNTGVGEARANVSTSLDPIFCNLRLS